MSEVEDIFDLTVVGGGINAANGSKQPPSPNLNKRPILYMGPQEQTVC